MVADAVLVAVLVSDAAAAPAAAAVTVSAPMPLAVAAMESDRELPAARFVNAQISWLTEAAHSGGAAPTVSPVPRVNVTLATLAAPGPSLNNCTSKLTLSP